MDAKPSMGCEMVMIEPEERVETVDESITMLGRYGRIDSQAVVESYVNLVKSKGEYVRDLPLCVVRITNEQADRILSEYINEGAQPINIVTPEGASLQVKPEMVQTGGLDASIKMSDIDPRTYLVLPFAQETLIPEPDFVVWCKGIPCQS